MTQFIKNDRKPFSRDVSKSSNFVQRFLTVWVDALIHAICDEMLHVYKCSHSTVHLSWSLGKIINF